MRSRCMSCTPACVSYAAGLSDATHAAGVVSSVYIQHANQGFYRLHKVVIVIIGVLLVEVGLPLDGHLHLLLHLRAHLSCYGTGGGTQETTNF